MTVIDAQELARLTTSVLLLSGEYEVLCRKTGPHVLERARPLIPGIQTELIPGGGHLVTLDQAEAANHELLAFI